jgi:hypothetical protein
MRVPSLRAWLYFNQEQMSSTSFNKHLFISYAHVDNMMTSDDNQGWVTRFHSSLKAFLSGAIGEEAVIWRDDKLRGNDVFADEIVDQFPETALLVSIVSPRYLMSEWCLREIQLQGGRRARWAGDRQ